MDIETGMMLMAAVIVMCTLASSGGSHSRKDAKDALADKPQEGAKQKDDAA